MAQGREQAAGEIGLQQSSSQETLVCSPDGNFPSDLEHHLEPHLRMMHPKSRLGMQQGSAKVNLAL